MMIEMLTQRIERMMPQPELLRKAKEINGKGIDIKNLDEPLKISHEGREGLNWAEKEAIQLESGYSAEIVDNISSMEEYRIYKEAGLREEIVNGKPCLLKENIAPLMKDEFGRTNKERMQKGLAPLTEDSQSVELHHIGQRSDSPLAELTMREHRGAGNDTILHDKMKVSEIDRNAFVTEKAEHWKQRANQLN